MEYVPVTGTWFIDPERFAQWERLEANKKAAYSHLNAVVNPKTGKIENKNYGVYKLRSLADVRDAQLAFYDARGWTRDQTMAHVTQKRMSHGHCVASKY